MTLEIKNLHHMFKYYKDVSIVTRLQVLLDLQDLQGQVTEEWSSLDGEKPLVLPLKEHNYSI